MRHIKFGEGDYNVTENLIRQLPTDANPYAPLAPRAHLADTTPLLGLTRETYLSVGKVVNYAGVTPYEQGEANFDYPASQPGSRHVRPGALVVRCRVGAPLIGTVGDAPLPVTVTVPVPPMLQGPHHAKSTPK